jgi:DNA polymerase
MLHFYDFEVFKYDWLVVIINPILQTITKIHNDKEALEKYFEKYNKDIWSGYNVVHYDQYILKSILLDMNPKEVNDFIIRDGRDGWQYSSLFKKINMINFDLMLKNDGGLKSLEGMMGSNIKETSVPFDIDRSLTSKEIEETFKYCEWDVEKSIDVFLARKAEFDAAVGLCKIFELPANYIGKTGAQRVSAILGGDWRGDSKDQFDFQIVPTLKLNKYKACCDWYKDPENQDYMKKQIKDICGIPHTIAWGGLHGATGEITYNSKGIKVIKNKPYHGKGFFLMADVGAYYPSLQLRYKLGYRHMRHPENFEKIHGENLRFKALGDKAARLPYKIADNAISGQLKDKNSALYDPRENNAVCVNGQLLLIDLLEKLEPYIELIQSNTDGVLLKMPDHGLPDFCRNFNDWFTCIDDIVWEWEERTGMRMEFDVYNEVFQKDVNNYVLVGPDGKMKTKGKYTKSLSKIDNDLPIVNKALVDYMVKKIPVEKTINECDELIMFQKIVKLTGKYWRVWHNNKFTTDKCHRVFASLNYSDTYIGKCKRPGATIEKFGDTPDCCFIDNEDVNGKDVPNKLDRQWYIDLAKRRLQQYGVEV